MFKDMAIGPPEQLPMIIVEASRERAQGIARLVTTGVLLTAETIAALGLYRHSGSIGVSPKVLCGASLATGAIIGVTAYTMFYNFIRDIGIIRRTTRTMSTYEESLRSQ